MDNIPQEFWWISCAISTLTPLFSAGGAWLLYKFWPAIQERKQREAEYTEQQRSIALGIVKENLEWSRNELNEQQAEFKKLREENQKLREAIEKANLISEKRVSLFSLQNGILTELRQDMQRLTGNVELLVDFLKKENGVD